MAHEKSLKYAYYEFIIHQLCVARLVAQDAAVKCPTVSAALPSPRSHHTSLIGNPVLDLESVPEAKCAAFLPFSCSSS